MTISFKNGDTVKAECRMVPLWWEHYEARSLDELERRSYSPGVYAIEGCHDSQPLGGILYVGKTKRDGGPRPSDSLRSKCFWSDGGASGLFSDVWSVVLRHAAVQDHAMIDQVEKLLIRAHAPAFNNQDVRGALPCEYEDIVLLNAGAKGRLLPAVVGAWFVVECWK